uniref:Phosphoinositide-interacting protein n=1 Tax=Cyprinus carpio TaxID=7962 RepID=A0A8C1Y8N9_CYPCA
MTECLDSLFPTGSAEVCHSAVQQKSREVQGCGTSEDMSSVPDDLPLRDCPGSNSCEQLTPCSESTVLSMSHNKNFWTLQPAPGNCEYYWQAILLMTSGGSVLICGMVLSGLYFAGFSKMATNILGPALLSVGLVVLVVGLVLMPTTRQMRDQSATKHLCSYYKPHINP